MAHTTMAAQPPPTGLTHAFDTHFFSSYVSRHFGDLGNIVVDAYGNAVYSFTDSVISLAGPTSIIGHALVVSFTLIFPLCCFFPF
jgi:Cu/Zn superoxide dismutase